MICVPYKDKEKQLECQRKSYKANRDKRCKELYKRRKKIFKWYKEYKRNCKCQRCPEDYYECIDFHHVEKKELEILYMVHSGYSIKRIKKELEKCIPLCSNCHRKEHNPRTVAVKQSGP